MRTSGRTRAALRRMIQRRPHRRLSLLVWVLLLGACVGSACGTKDRPEAVSPLRPAQVERTRPAPPRIPAQRLKLDRFGNLRESADTLLGFPLPMGTELVGDLMGGITEMRIQTRMWRLTDFFRRRGYLVVEGQVGRQIHHSQETLSRTSDGEALRGARIDMIRSGRWATMRFVDPGPVASPAPANRLGVATDARPAPAAGVPPSGTDTRTAAHHRSESLEAAFDPQTATVAPRRSGPTRLVRSPLPIERRPPRRLPGERKRKPPPAGSVVDPRPAVQMWLREHPGEMFYD